jgi:microcystin-dependent protein
MAEKISSSKGFDDTTFDTYVPELSDNADIQNALELFYYGDSTDGNATGDVSIHANLVDFDARITLTTSGLSGHTGAISDVHGIGAGHSVVGTGTIQTLTNKTLTTPKLNENVTLTATSTELNILDGATLTTTELNYLDGTTSSIQTQINTNTPTGMISIHSGATAPTGWLLCDGTSYGSASYISLFSVVGYTFGGSGANFNVPNLKGKVVVGIDASQISFDTRGESGGAMTHQHDASVSGSAGSHAHSTTDHTHSTTDHSHNTTDHSHYSDHSHYADHSHYINPGETGTTSSYHDHTIGVSTGTGVATGTAKYAAPTGHTHSASSDNHSHNVNIATFLSANANGSGVTTGNSNYGNTAGANAGNTTSGASAGNTTGGASTGNTTDTEPVHTHTTPISSAESNLQPYIALNYIIKI